MNVGGVDLACKSCEKGPMLALDLDSGERESNAWIPTPGAGIAAGNCR